jgi:2'-5' RNA ligase
MDEETRPVKQILINIIPPRELWTSLNWTRGLYFKDLRCGPHITFINPLRLGEDEHLATVSENFQAACLELQPFSVTLEKFAMFVRCRTLVYLVPTFDPPEAFDRLVAAARQFFPQHELQLDNLTPHVSLAEFRSKEGAAKATAILEKDWKPVTFQVNELYILTRLGIDPFDVAHVIHLGPKNFTPYFGPNTAEPGSAVSRTLALVGLPPGKINTSEDLATLAANLGLKPSKMELMLQPNLKPRPLAIFEFDTREEAEDALQACNNKPYDDYTIWLKHLESITYPDVVGASSSRANYKKVTA